ncbi:MAG TPA: GAP family protein [Conexibacter sp.]|nr:GAP family protein [Conexibacter sp.]
MSLLLLAFEAALYPTLLAAVVILLSLDRPAVLIAAYLAGGMLVSVGLGVAIVLALGDTHVVKNEQAAVSWAVDLVFGGLILLAGLALATHQDDRFLGRRRERRAAKEEEHGRGEPWSQRVLARGSVPIVFVAALFVNVPGAAYLIALKDIAAGNHSTATEIGLIVLFNLIMFLLAEIPLAGLLIAPEPTSRLVARMNDWLHDNTRKLAVGVCLTLGAYLVVRGLVNS